MTKQTETKKKKHEVEIIASQRVDLIIEIINLGYYSNQMIISFINKDILKNKENSKYNWNVTKQTIYRYIAKARELLYTENKLDFLQLNKVLMYQLENLYIKAMQNNNIDQCLTIIDKIAKLNGLYSTRQIDMRFNRITRVESKKFDKIFDNLLDRVHLN